MIKTNDLGLTFFQYPHLAQVKGLFHGHFTRTGGVSTHGFQSMNVSLDVGDVEASVRENRKRLKDFLKARELVELTQVHGTVVYVREKGGRADNVSITADAMVTAEPGVMLLIKTADCQPVFLYDPVKNVVGNIHSGWRGSVANIIGETVRVMVDRFNCNPLDLLAGVGPSLGPCCAEFVNYAAEISAKYWPYKDDRHHMDFWAVSQAQLMDEGVKEENIMISRLCTSCNHDLFFSYRRDKLTGRLANVIGLL